MENWKEIRQQVLVNGLSQRGACEKYQLGRQTLKNILSHSEPPGLPKGQVTFRASPGLLGLWIRRGEPQGPMPPKPPAKLPFPVHLPIGSGHSGPALH